MERIDKDRRIFLKKICLCLQFLGAESDLLCTVNSWGDTLENKEVIAMLDLWLNDKINRQNEVLISIRSANDS